MPKGASGSPTAGLWVIGRDWGTTETSQQQPFVGKSGTVLEGAFTEASIRRSTIYIDNIVREQPKENDWRRHKPGAIDAGVEALHALLKLHKPTVVVPLGNEAFKACMGYHPDDKVDLPKITEARGYLWDSCIEGIRVIPSIHPSFVMRAGNWVPWRIFLSFDLKKAKREFELGAPEPTLRETTIVSSDEDMQGLIADLDSAEIAALDIENNRDLELSCLGIATSINRAWVIPLGRFPFWDWQLKCIKEVCNHPVRKLFQNGMYDNYFLRFLKNFSENPSPKYGINVRNWTDDTMLMWHTLFPELAGTGRSKAKRTAKSLSVFASIMTRTAWWKNYDFSSDEERFILCGKDCCITLESWMMMEEDL